MPNINFTKKLQNAVRSPWEKARDRDLATLKRLSKTVEQNYSAQCELDQIRATLLVNFVHRKVGNLGLDEKESRSATTAGLLIEVLTRLVAQYCPIQKETT